MTTNCFRSSGKMSTESSPLIANMRQQLTALLTFPGTHREQAEKYKTIRIGGEPLEIIELFPGTGRFLRISWNKVQMSWWMLSKPMSSRVSLRYPRITANSISPLSLRSYQRTSESGHFPANPLGSGHTVDETSGRCFQCNLPLHTGQGAAQSHFVRGTSGEYSTTPGGHL